MALTGPPGLHILPPYFDDVNRPTVGGSQCPSFRFSDKHSLTALTIRVAWLSCLRVRALPP